MTTHGRHGRAVQEIRHYFMRDPKARNRYSVACNPICHLRKRSP